MSRHRLRACFLHDLFIMICVMNSPVLSFQSLYLFFFGFSSRSDTIRSILFVALEFFFFFFFFFFFMFTSIISKGGILFSGVLSFTSSFITACLVLSTSVSGKRGKKKKKGDTVNLRYSKSKTHANVRHNETFVMGNSLNSTGFSHYITNLLSQIYAEYLAITNPNNSRLQLSLNSKGRISWAKSKARNT